MLAAGVLAPKLVGYYKELSTIVQKYSILGIRKRGAKLVFGATHRPTNSVDQLPMPSRILEYPNS